MFLASINCHCFVTVSCHYLVTDCHSCCDHLALLIFCFRLPTQTQKEKGRSLMIVKAHLAIQNMGNLQYHPLH